jgi:hypothetical protein
MDLIGVYVKRFSRTQQNAVVHTAVLQADNPRIGQLRRRILYSGSANGGVLNNFQLGLILRVNDIGFHILFLLSLATVKLQTAPYSYGAVCITSLP